MLTRACQPTTSMRKLDTQSVITAGGASSERRRRRDHLKVIIGDRDRKGEEEPSWCYAW